MVLNQTSNVNGNKKQLLYSVQYFQAIRYKMFISTLVYVTDYWAYMNPHHYILIRIPNTDAKYILHVYKHVRKPIQPKLLYNDGILTYSFTFKILNQLIVHSLCINYVLYYTISIPSPLVAHIIRECVNR